MCTTRFESKSQFLEELGICGYCQKTLFMEDSIFLDNELTIYCSVYCLSQVLNNIQHQKGWKHNSIYYSSYDNLISSSDQNIYDSCLNLFKQYNISKDSYLTELAQNIIRTIYSTKSMSNKQKIVLCQFYAHCQEFPHFLLEKVTS